MFTRGARKASPRGLEARTAGAPCGLFGAAAILRKNGIFRHHSLVREASVALSPGIRRVVAQNCGKQPCAPGGKGLSSFPSFPHREESHGQEEEKARGRGSPQ